MPEPEQPRLAREVKVFGAASFLTDVAADMVRPLLPIFLRTVLRAGGTELGLIEGAAEAASSLLKIASGWLDDRLRGPANLGRRKAVVVLGYALAAFARPLAGVATSPIHVLLTRVGDRIGKGIRTAPRDAWIADVTPPALRGRAYGLHRALDNAGAFAGPLVALALFHLLGLELRQVFLLSIVPALLGVVVLIVGLRSRARPGETALPHAAPPRSASSPSTRKEEGMPSSLRRYLFVVTLFTFGGASQAFLVLRLVDAGVPEWGVLLVWTGHSGLTALLNVPLAALSDKLGRKRTIAAGWVTFALVHLGFGLAHSVVPVLFLFALLSAYFALTEGAERALLAELAPPSVRGRAFGIFHACVGLATLPGNLVFGAIWDATRPEIALFASAGVAVTSAAVLLFVVPEAARPTGAHGG